MNADNLRGFVLGYGEKNDDFAYPIRRGLSVAIQYVASRGTTASQTSYPTSGAVSISATATATAICATKSCSPEWLPRPSHCVATSIGLRKKTRWVSRKVCRSATNPSPASSGPHPTPAGPSPNPSPAGPSSHPNPASPSPNPNPAGPSSNPNPAVSNS